MWNSTCLSYALCSEQSAFSFEATWATVGLARKLWASILCDFSDCNLNKNVFHISSRNRFSYEASFYYFSVISILYEVTDKKKALPPLPIFSAFLILSFLISCKVFPVHFTSCCKAMRGSLQTGHASQPSSTPCYCKLIICMFPHHRVSRVVETRFLSM